MELPRNMVFIKKSTKSKSPTIGLVILTKFHNNWIKYKTSKIERFKIIQINEIITTLPYRGVRGRK